MVRKSIEKLYTDTCNIYEYQKVKDPVTKRTEFEPILIHENVKCRISFKNITTTDQTTGEAITGQITVLFIKTLEYLPFIIHIRKLYWNYIRRKHNGECS